ncbi:hypothetical protein ES706_04257 [subsurface metagenome]
MKMKKLLYWLIIVLPLLASILLPATPVQAQTTETLRPDAAGDYQEWETLAGSSHWEATSDISNTTYIQTGNTSAPRDIQHLADPSFYSGSRINSVTYYVTANASGSGAGESVDMIAKLGASEQVVDSKVSITRGSFNDYDSGAQTTAPDGASWTYQKVTDLQAGIAVNTLGSGETLSVSEIWVVVDYSLPSISNTPNTYAFGVVSEGSTSETGLTHFEVTNNSGYAINITIGGTDMTGGVIWTLSDNAIPGTDTYGLKAGLAGTSYNITVMKNSPYNILISNLADSSSQQWGLQLLAPTSFTGGGLVSGNVTLTATQA